MQISAPDVQVAVLVAQEEQRRGEIDDHADARHPEHHLAPYGFGMEQLANALDDDGADGDQQDDGVEQRNENRAAAVAVGIAARGAYLRQAERQQGEQQARHVAQVVPRVGEQPHRIGEDARRELRGDENRVQQNARDESAVERREPPNVFVGVIVMRMRHKLRLTINPCGGVPDAVFRYLPCRPAAADELFGHGDDGRKSRFTPANIRTLPSICNTYLSGYLPQPQKKPDFPFRLFHSQGAARYCC